MATGAQDLSKYSKPIQENILMSELLMALIGIPGSYIGPTEVILFITERPQLV